MKPDFSKFRFCVFALFFVFTCPLIVLAETELTIIQTSDIHGEIEPCGCAHNPLGGAERLGVLIDLEKKEKDVILLDSGGLFFPSDDIPQIDKDISHIKARSNLKIMNLLNLKSTVHTSTDLAAGEPFFKSLRGKAEFDFLATNTVSNKKQWTSFKSAGVNVKVLGFVSKDHFRKPMGEKWLPPFEALKNILDADHNSTKSKAADIYLITSHLGLEADKELARDISKNFSKKYKGKIPLIFGGRDEAFLEKPTLESGIYIVQPKNENHYVNLIKLMRTKNSWKITHHELKALDASFDPKDENISGNVSEIQKIQQNTKKKIAAVAEAVEKFSPDKKFKGAVSCSRCHAKAFAQWSTTAHASAILTLYSEKQASNPKCLSCHTTSLSKPDGYAAPSAITLDSKGEASKKTSMKLSILMGKWAKSLEKPVRDDPSAAMKVTKKIHSWTKKKGVLFTGGVQCETCHTITSDHPVDPPESLTMKARCLKCHTPKRNARLYNPDQSVKEELFKKMLKSVSH